MVQTGCGFLSGGRRGATAEDKEDCFGRATVALTRAIQHTYIVSPIDMAGLIRIAQTLAVYHYGYYTLKDRTVQFHEPKHVPSDAEAVLEWGLDTPFSASYNGYPVLVHRLRGSKMYFHQATKDRRILLIPGIHYFDAHRLQSLCCKLLHCRSGRGWRAGGRSLVR